MKCERCAEPINGTFGSGRFCNRACANARPVSAQKKEERKPKFELRCPQCTKVILTSNKSQKFCSRKCVTASNQTSEKCRVAGRRSAEVQRQTRRSQNEIHFATLCQAAFENVLVNERMFEGWDADVILPHLKIAILWNGKWHYEQIANHKLLQVQTRDMLKLQAIDRCGYKAYVIKDLGKANERFVQQEFDKFLGSIAG